jgi:hypothetical protein
MQRHPAAAPPADASYVGTYAHRGIRAADVLEDLEELANGIA